MYNLSVTPSGGLAIEAPPRAIWDVLTDYNSLNEYIPNIAASGAVLQPNGRVRIEQVGVISPTLRITTRIVLEVVEEPYRKLTFSKVESREFVEFEGTYSITQMDGADTSYLEYSVEALPLPILPIQLVQGKIKQEVPPMLAAVRTNANKYHQLRTQTHGPYWMEDLPVPVRCVCVPPGSSCLLHLLFGGIEHGPFLLGTLISFLISRTLCRARCRLSGGLASAALQGTIDHTPRRAHRPSLLLLLTLPAPLCRRAAEATARRWMDQQTTFPTTAPATEQGVRAPCTRSVYACTPKPTADLLTYASCFLPPYTLNGGTD